MAGRPGGVRRQHAADTVGGLIAAALMLAFHAVVDKDRNLAEELPHLAIPARMVAFGAMATVVFAFAATGSVPFLYSAF